MSTPDFSQDDLLAFLSKVFVTASGCWTGPAAAFYTDPSGRLRSCEPHRLVFEIERSLIPRGWCVVRTCQFAHCLAPGHLQAVPPGRRSTAVRSSGTPGAGP